jgi:hypothetical protein
LLVGGVAVIGCHGIRRFTQPIQLDKISPTAVGATSTEVAPFPFLSS